MKKKYGFVIGEEKPFELKYFNDNKFSRSKFLVL